MAVTGGTPFDEQALAQQSDRDIVVTVLHDGLPAGGMTWQINPKGRVGVTGKAKARARTKTKTKGKTKAKERSVGIDATLTRGGGGGVHAPPLRVRLKHAVQKFVSNWVLIQATRRRRKSFSSAISAAWELSRGGNCVQRRKFRPAASPTSEAIPSTMRSRLSAENSPFNSALKRARYRDLKSGSRNRNRHHPSLK